jgi:hypothetical protein
MVTNMNRQAPCYRQISKKKKKKSTKQAFPLHKQLLEKLTGLQILKGRTELSQCTEKMLYV